MSDQMIFKRYELKYLLSQEQRELIEQSFDGKMTADIHGHSTILSLYLDTPDFLLARRSLEKPLYKEKLRLRSYGLADEDTPIFVELKKKYDSIVYKRRIAMPLNAADDYITTHKGVEDSQISREIGYCLDHYNNLTPKVLLSYERDAWYAEGDSDFRVTFDENILWRDCDVNLTSGIYGKPILEKGQSLMEIKTSGAIPLWLVRILSENKIYRTSFSKYGRAYCTILNDSAMPHPALVASEINKADNYREEGKYHYA
jgi:hypothetical protein